MSQHSNPYEAPATAVVSAASAKDARNAMSMIVAFELVGAVLWRGTTALSMMYVKDSILGLAQTNVTIKLLGALGTLYGVLLLSAALPAAVAERPQLVRLARGLAAASAGVQAVRLVLAIMRAHEANFALEIVGIVIDGAALFAASQGLASLSTASGRETKSAVGLPTLGACYFALCVASAAHMGLSMRGSPIAGIRHVLSIAFVILAVTALRRIRRWQAG